MINSKTYLFVDGTNFYAASYELFGPEKYLDFSKFIKEVEKKLKLKFKKIFFYASYSPQPPKPTKKQKLYLKNEALFYKGIRGVKKVKFFKGYRSRTSGREKGIDIHLAVDMVKRSLLGEYKKACILTGDADFIYPIKIVQGLKIPVHAIFLPNRFSLEIAFKASSAVVFDYRGDFKKEKKMPKRLEIVQIKRPHMHACGVG